MSLIVSLWDIGLLTAACSLIILLVSEVLSPHYGRVNILLDIKKLKLTAAALVLTFLAVGITIVTSEF